MCSYHAWTYALDGELRSLPKQEMFAGLDTSRYRLRALAWVERGGFIWTRLDGKPIEAGSVLGGIEHDFDALKLEESTVFDCHTHEVNANWKLIMDAFLESYHVKRLHKNTIAPFFADSITASERVGHHFRNAVARNDYTEAQPTDSLDELRLLVTFSYSLMPSMVVVVSPDYINAMLIYPQSYDRTVVEDYMFIAQPTGSDDERSHMAESFKLLDRGVFGAEDFRAAQLVQRGLQSGWLNRVTLGAAEQCLAEFHQTVDDLIVGEK